MPSTLYRLADLKRIVLVLHEYMRQTYERVETLLSEQQPNVTGLDLQMTQRVHEHRPAERFGEDHIRRYLTPALLTQVPPVDLDPEEA